jgi:hypothetical protein
VFRVDAYHTATTPLESELPLRFSADAAAAADGVRRNSAYLKVVVDTGDIQRHTSHVTRHTSQVTRHTSHVTHHTSHITHHTSHVKRHTSHVTRHTSHLTRHTLHATFHISPVIRHRSQSHHNTQWQKISSVSSVFTWWHLLPLRRFKVFSVITRHTSHVTRHTSHVTRHTSHVSRHTSQVTRHSSRVTRHTPSGFALAMKKGLYKRDLDCLVGVHPTVTRHVTRHTSDVTRHTSHVTLHTSQITRHTSRVTRHSGDRISDERQLDHYQKQW